MCAVLAAGIVAVVLNLLLPQEAPEGTEPEEQNQDEGDVEEVHYGADNETKMEKV